MSDLDLILRTLELPSSGLSRLSRAGGDYYVEVPGAVAVARWSALRNVVEETGYWPTLLGGEADLARHAAGLANPPADTSAEVLAEARGLDSEAWLHARLMVLRHQYPDLHEDWPADVEHDDTFSIPYDQQTAAVRLTCYLGLVPATASWHVPALLRFGGGTPGPSTAEHTSVLARWERMYAAEIVGMTRTVLELTVGNPPGEPDQALELAEEQLAYCPDIVLQGTLTVERLAATLLNGQVWFFSWT